MEMKMEADDDYPLTGWRHDWATISLWLFELQDHHSSHDLPGWFISVTLWIALFVIDPIVDISTGSFPDTWKGCWPNRFVDEWHRDFRGGPAPYGKAAHLAALRRIRSWLPVPRN